MPKPTERLRYLKTLGLYNGDTWSPPGGSEARIIGGYITHVGATASQLLIRAVPDLPIYASIVNIPSITCSNSFSVNPVTAPTSYEQRLTSRPEETWIDSRFEFAFIGGGTTSQAVLIVEVVKIDEYTGEHLA